MQCEILFEQQFFNIWLARKSLLNSTRSGHKVNNEGNVINALALDTINPHIST